MTKVELLSAALIAATMLASPAMARERHLTSQHPVLDANASIAPGCHLAPAVGAFATAPWGKGPPCEPASAR
jgi:hypothetical protein